MRAWSWVLWSLALGCQGESEDKPSPAPPACGDGALGEGEACDEGEANSDEGECTLSCALATCGDGLVWAGREGCDEGAANGDDSACTLACALASCGDGLLSPGEQCDQGEANDDASECTASCLLAACGDGHLWQGNEPCDDGNAFGGDGCGPSCVLPAQALLSDSAVLHGGRVGDTFGTNLLRAGDLNGDGVDDLVIAASYAPGGWGNGEIYVFHGPLTAGITLQDADARLLGEEPLASAGRGLASGDLNGDGIGDLVVASSDGEGAGIVYVVYGPVEGTIELADVEAKIKGDPGAHNFGTSLAVADVNGDGLDDLAVGDQFAQDRGAISVLFGPIVGERLAADADVRLVGEAQGDYAGTVDTMDANGDGAVDLVIGAPQHSSGALHNGAVYVVFGPVTEDRPLAEADLKFVGEGDGDGAGYSLSNAGDLDGDGQEDLLVAAPFFDQAGQDRGLVYALYGPLETDLELQDVEDRLLGAHPDERIGVTLDGGGDADGDGFADVLIGSPLLSSTAYGQGGAYVVHGPVQGAHGLDLADLTLYGTIEEEFVGSSACFAGDLDGDGDDELVLGAWSSDVNGYDAGAAYVVFGS